MKSRNLSPPVTLSLGFTGTQEGMTIPQYQRVHMIVVNLKPSHAHHGDCIGADAQFHDICRMCGVYVIGHPGMDEFKRSPKRANCQVDEVRPTYPYLLRNTYIVDAVDQMIGAPKGYEEELQSGTWSTIRKAKKKELTVYIVYPDGSVG